MATLPLESYLFSRDQDSEFLMLELGHGPYPVAFQQPGGFTGNRAYIGSEAWTRDSEGRSRAALSTVRTTDPSGNIFFIEQSLGKTGEGNHQEPYEIGSKILFKGPYDPTTVLPSGIASEVVLSNLVGDPQIAHSRRRVRRLLKEVSRLTAHDGLVVVRETESPRQANRHLERLALLGTGLRKFGARITPDEEAIWQQLEARFGVKKGYDKGASFYQFLAKAVHADIFPMTEAS